MIQPSRMKLRYPIQIYDIPIWNNNHKVVIEASGATSDCFVAHKYVDKRASDNIILRGMSCAQKDQCARECRNLWGPIWKNIWRYEWDANKKEMKEERVKALAEYRNRK